MSTVRVLVLAHHHGNWRIVRVDKLQLSSAARAIQSSPPLAARCITTTPQPGSTLALAPTPTEMRLVSFFTKAAPRSGEPDATNLQCGPAVVAAPTATRIPPKSLAPNQRLQLAGGLADESSDRHGSSQRRDSFRRPKGVRLTKLLSMNPSISLEECLDSHHVIPRPISALTPFESLHGHTEGLDSPTPGTRLGNLSNFPYIVTREQDMKARRERIWSEIEKKASPLDRRAKNQACFLDGGQHHIEEVQTLCDEFNDVYDHFGSLIAELDHMIHQHGESIRCDSACQAATAALVETMAQREQNVFETLSVNYFGNAGDARSSDNEDNDGPAEGRVTDEGSRQSSQPLRADTDDSIESTGSPRSKIPILDPTECSEASTLE
ncbi:hypothetical protein AC579_392 [Pseudocercospora musae]|uniref:Uncharacterized protein n=1 Tax=Pseudocercospora musae TaxID=113226 RepID=A0A139I3J2_9PEZI|nr:hypothetical protein AC579_392 [Pseudocercospora musae]